MTQDKSRKVTIAEVARLAGVGTATAGRVLGGYGYSSEDVRNRVQESARKLGYRPNQLARSLQRVNCPVSITDIHSVLTAGASAATQKKADGQHTSQLQCYLGPHTLRPHSRPVPYGATWALAASLLSRTAAQLTPCMRPPSCG